MRSIFYSSFIYFFLPVLFVRMPELDCARLLSSFSVRVVFFLFIVFYIHLLLFIVYVGVYVCMLWLHILFHN